MIPTLEWTADGVRFLDQTRLPLEETYVMATTSDQVATIITTMVVRGAPAIGVAAAMGVALGIKNSSAKTVPALTSDLEGIAKTLAATRPTAVNLFWAIERMRATFEKNKHLKDVEEVKKASHAEQLALVARHPRPLDPGTAARSGSPDRASARWSRPWRSPRALRAAR